MRFVLISVLWFAVCAVPLLSQANTKKTDSRRPYVHQIPLYDREERKIDPRAEGAGVYSPQHTCKKCHDIDTIAQGWHFNAAVATDAGRRGEPWLLTDPKTGTVLPLSYRGWPQTYRPDQVGIDPSSFLREFGRHLPGHSAGVTGADTGAGRFRISGPLEIDCMVCHGADPRWSPEHWAKEIAKENFAWAPSVALALATVEGAVKGLKDDFDPKAEGAAQRLPRLVYDPARFAPDGTAFFDVVRKPKDTACLTCHSNHHTDSNAPPRWQDDGDVHTRAGLSCVDCHRNGLAHHTVRGYEGERHPAGDVTSLSCRGCHLDQTDGHGNVTSFGGRLGSPKAEHKGLPKVHLEKMACTACHSGPTPKERPHFVQTSMAHGLGIPSQTRTAEELPLIAEPVFLPGEDGKLAPHRQVWPSFWAYEVSGVVTPIAPDVAYKTIRGTLRVRKDLREELGNVKLTASERALVVSEARVSLKDEELTEDERRRLTEATSKKTEAEFLTKLQKTLAALKKARADAEPLYLSAGNAYRLAPDGTTVTVATHAAAAPYAWPLAHDVRPARKALGVKGCTECHASGAPLFYGEVAANGPAPSTAPRKAIMYQLMEQDTALMQQWERGFEGRDAFKWTALVALGVVLLVLLLWLILGVDGLARRVMGRTLRESDPTP